MLCSPEAAGERYASGVRYMAFVRHRDWLPSLLAERGLVGVGVEVGVQRGVYAERILSGSRLTRLILVHPWQEFDGYEDVASVAQADHDAVLADARQRLARFGTRAEFWRMPSLEAAPRIADGTLDF